MPEPPRKIDLYRGVFLPAGYPVFREIGHIQPLLAKFSHPIYHLFLSITSAEKGFPDMALYVPGTS